MIQQICHSMNLAYISNVVVTRTHKFVRTKDLCDCSNFTSKYTEILINTIALQSQNKDCTKYHNMFT